MAFDSNHLESRFIKEGDDRSDHFFFPLHSSWWSRPYEYAWAGTFAEKEDIALDAACGLCHPLKFHLLDHSREVYACDFDPRILSRDEILSDVESNFGKTAAIELPDRYLKEIRYVLASITSLPYRDGMFDKIYCISTLEHLRDPFNRYPALRIAKAFLPLRRDIRDALREFRRVLSPTGKIVLTFDYPIIDLGYLQDVLKETGLQPAGGTEFQCPPDAIHSTELGLWCFRMALTHAPGRGK